MYGLQSSELANAVMADRHRSSAQLARNRVPGRTRRSRLWFPKSEQSITAMLGDVLAAGKLALFRPRPAPSLQ
jgi:hypothetical protein